MKLKTRFFTVLGSLGLATLMPSCQSTGSASTAGTDAVLCNKCKAVWVSTPTSIGSPGRNPITVYRDTKSMTCPECESAITTFFKTGSLKHSCTACGGALVHCTQH